MNKLIENVHNRQLIAKAMLDKQDSAKFMAIFGKISNKAIEFLTNGSFLEVLQLFNEYYIMEMEMEIKKKDTTNINFRDPVELKDLEKIQVEYHAQKHLFKKLFEVSEKLKDLKLI